MALEQTNLVEKESVNEQPRNTVGAFRASGLPEVSRFLRPSSTIPPLAPMTPKNPLVGNYLDRALSGIQSFAAPAPTPLATTSPIVVASNTAANERDTNFALYGTNFPTQAQIAAREVEDNQRQQPRQNAFARRMEEQLRPVNYNPSSTI